jgi:uncharacterized membrane protein
MAEATLKMNEIAAGGYRSPLMAALSYLGILCFVPLIMNKDDEYVYFHSRQGLVLWTWSVLAMFALHLPVVGKWLFGFSSMAILVLSVAGLVSVAFRRAWRLPLVSSLAAAF